MPSQSKLTVNQIAKDIEGIKGKDITEMLAPRGIDIKPAKTLEPWEFGVVFECLTSANQIKDIYRYIDGETEIPSILPKPQPVKQEKAESGEKSAKPQTESAPTKEQPSVKPELEKPVAKPESKPEVKPEPKPAAKPETKPEVKAEPKPEPKPAETKPAEPKPAVKPAAPARPAAPLTQNQLNKQRMEAQKNGERLPQQTFARPQRPEAPAAPARHERTFENNRTGDNRQFDNNRQQTGNRPQNGQPQREMRPAFDNKGNRDGRDNFNKDNNRDSRFNNNNAQKPQFGNRPDRGQNGGFGGFDKDKESSRPSGPKVTYHPTEIVRGQTPKGTEGQHAKGATRVVDTRTSNVDLSKYDEKLDTFATDDNMKDSGKNKKPVANRQQQPNANSTKNNAPQLRQPMQKGQKPQKKGAPAAPIKKMPLNVQIPDEITVGELAQLLKTPAGEVVKRLMMTGIMATVNQVIDFDTASLIAEDMGAVVTREVVVSIEEKLFDENEDKDEDLVTRAPVVCVMGHVDHGKTSLLDAIRHTNVTTGEAGGITQHIGAYRVKINDREITFLDTPGHEAFTAMRARGAQATDIAILVVAADDGIMPQTVEAINHAKAAGIDIIVAINKMDKPTANPDQIKTQLTKYDLVPEEWGGDVMCVPVSALTGMGIEELLEDVLLVADVKELKANPNRRAKGIVIEAKLDKGRGPVATILVQNGTLRPGDIVIAGTAVGRVRAMTDHKGKAVKVAGPSVPVEITGLDAVPTAGDEFNGVEDERMARELADRRRASAKEESFKANARASLDDLFAQISEGVKTLNVIVKADVDGSVEAVKQSLQKISNDEVKVSVIHAAVGGITEGDVMFAAASNAIIVGFNVRPDKQALDSSERQGVEIRTYRVIYECIDEITAAMKGMLAPKFREQLLGHIEVRQIFKISKVGTIAGSYVQDGKITRSSKVRVVRDGIVIAEDDIASLRREKDDVKEVMAGYECGIGLEKFKDIKIGDVLEAYVMEEVQQ